MSIQAVSRAFKQDVRPSSAKFVLIAMADCANGKGLCFPSVAYLCRATAQDRKTVMRGIETLIGLELLSDTGERCGVTGQIKVYRLAGELAAAIDKQSQKRDSSNSAENGTLFDGKESRFSLERVPFFPTKSPKNGTRNHKEPSGTYESGAQARLERPENELGRTSPKGARLPSGWQPSAADSAFAEELGLNAQAVAEEFRDYWAGVPGSRGRKSDWPATWRNRCRELAGKTIGRRPQAVNGNGAHRGGDLATMDEQSMWRTRLRGYKPGAKWWPGNWGPRPESKSPHSHIPKAILAEWERAQ